MVRCTGSVIDLAEVAGFKYQNRSDKDELDDIAGNGDQSKDPDGD